MDIAAIRRHYELLNHKNYGVTELVSISPDKVITGIGYFDNVEDLIAACEEWEGKANLYVVKNPVKRELFERSPNKLKKLSSRAKKEDISAQTFFFLDIDVERDEARPASEEKQRLALAKAEELINNISWLKDCGIFSSGNGAYVVGCLQFTEQLEKIEDILKSLEARIRNDYFGTVKLKLDSVQDRSRLMALMGTTKIKGKADPDHPYRETKIIRSPDPVCLPLREEIERLIISGSANSILPSFTSLPICRGVQSLFQAPPVVEDRSLFYQRLVNHMISKRWQKEEIRSALLDLDSRLPRKKDKPKQKFYEQSSSRQEYLLDYWISHALPHSLPCSMVRELGASSACPPTCKEREKGLSPSNKPSAKELAREFLSQPDWSVTDLEAEDLGALKLLYWRDGWWRWDGLRFKSYSESDLQAEISAYLLSQFERNGGQNFNNLICNVIGGLKGLCHVKPEVAPPVLMPQSPKPQPASFLLSTLSGVLDLEAMMKGEAEIIYPLSPSLFTLTGLPYAYSATADCPKWKAFLNENLPDPSRQELLQEWFGCCLLPEQPVDKFLVLHGEGANGKSVVLRTLEAMLGPENVSHVPLESFSGSFDLSITLGKLANICSDLGVSYKADEGKLKQFVCGETMTFNRKFREPLSLRPTAKLIFATNQLPSFEDKTEGIWRRLLLLPFEIEIPEERRNLNLAEEIREEVSGILLWALEGLKRLYQRGYKFNEPLPCRQAREAHRLETNSVREFLLENVEKVEGGEIESSELYAAYQQWARENGYQPTNARNLGKEIKRLWNIERKQRRRGKEGRRGYYYPGLRWKALLPARDVIMSLCPPILPQHTVTEDFLR